MSNNVRIIKIPNTLSSKFAWQALFKKLPDDAIIQEAHTNWTADSITIKVWSDSYSEVQENSYTPEIDVSVTDQDIVNEMFSSMKLEEVVSKKTVKECQCQLEYTGLKTHRIDCPRRT